MLANKVIIKDHLIVVLPQIILVLKNSLCRFNMIDFWPEY